MDAKGALASAYEVSSLSFTPTEVLPHLWAMTMSTEDSLREYLRLFVRIPLVARLGPLAHMFDFIADAAPGVKEILGVGKICYEVRERHYDLVVVDAEASGHVVAQIAAPQAIRQLVQVGLVRDQTKWMIEILHDPATTGLEIVTTPEEMPVTEAIELVERVRNETHIDIVAVVANRVLPALFTERESSVFHQLTTATIRGRLEAVAGTKVNTVLDAAVLTEARRAIGAEHLDRLRASLGSMPPVLIIPELFTRAAGRRVVSLVAQAISDEIV